MIANEAEDTYQPERVTQNAHRLVLLSGCSGAGKSSLLAELACRSHAVCEEPGRQVVREQRHIGGDALLLSYRSFGYRTVIVPKTDVKARAYFVLEAIGGKAA